MKRAALAILIMSMLSTQASAGWRFGNGGDGMRLAFLKAKEHAANITSRLNSRAIERIPDPEVRAWLEKNHLLLSADILKSDHLWYMDKKPTCAWTNDPSDTQVIHLSFEKCADTINNFEEAGQLLIHESTHHLGVDNESLADRIALAVYQTWKSGDTEWLPMSQSESPAAVMRPVVEAIDNGVVIQGGLLNSDQTTNAFYKYSVEKDTWETLSSQGAPNTYGAQSVWTGSKLIVWGGFKRAGTVNIWQNSGAIWDSKSGVWTKVKCQFGPVELDDFARIEDNTIQTLVWTGNEAIVFGGALVAGKAPGGMFDPETVSHNCRQMTATSYPKNNIAHSAVWADDRMIIFGGNENRTVSDGMSVFAPSTNKWTKIYSSVLPEARDGHTAVWTGSQMIVYGGRGVTMRTLTIDGGIYDAKTGWSLFNSDTMFGRNGHTAVWTGNEMVVFGGKPNWTSGIGKYLNSIFAFNPASKTWRVVESQTAPMPRMLHGTAWTGSSLVVFGGLISVDRATSTGGVFFP
jgi:N-acetylneuraminic acid mutarotase